MPITNYGRDQILDAVWNADVAGLPGGDLYLQLHSGDPNATGVSNVVSVARSGVAMGAASSGVITSVSDADFSSMPTTTVYGWSAWDAAGSGTPPTGGNCWWWGVMMGSTPLEGVADTDSTDIGSDLLQCASHGLTTDDRVAFFTAYGTAGGTPGGPALFGTGSGVLYYVLASGLTTNEFKVSTSSGGAALNVSSDGQIAWKRVVGTSVTSGQTFRIGTGNLLAYLEA